MLSYFGVVHGSHWQRRYTLTPFFFQTAVAGGRGAVLQHGAEQVQRVGRHELALVLLQRAAQGVCRDVWLCVCCDVYLFNYYLQ